MTAAYIVGGSIREVLLALVLAVLVLAVVLAFIAAARPAWLDKVRRDHSPTDLAERKGSDVEDRGSTRRHEPLLIDVALVIAGPIVIAIGYLIQFNAITYARGDYRGTSAYGADALALDVIGGVVLVAVATSRLVLGFHRRRNGS